MKSCSNPKCKLENPQPLSGFCVARGKHQNRCKSCKNETTIRWRKNNPELYTSSQKRSFDKWYEVNAGRVILSAKEWASANPTKVKAIAKKWRQNNPAKVSEKTRFDQSRKLRATPSWLTKAQRAEMVELYSIAKELQWLSQEPLEVDHIIPIQEKNVTGLHVPWNLQIIPRSQNRRKGNKTWPKL